MRPRLAEDAFNSPDHLFEVKWDGIRALVSSDATGLRIVDRNGGDLRPAVPELAGLRLPEGTLLDGEVIVCDSRGRPDYDLLVGRLGGKAKRGKGPLFVAFDLLYEGGRPILGLALAERRRRLQAGGFAGKGLVVPEHLESDGEPFLAVVAEYGLEGIVAKRRDGRYVPGARSADWLKCLVTPRSDVAIGGLVVDEARGARGLLCGWTADDGTLTFAGEAYVPPYLGGWLDNATRAFRTDGSPFAGPMPLRPGTVWLRPRLVAIVEHEGRDGSGLIDARFRALRFDGRLDECRPEEPVEVPTFPPIGGPDRPRLVVLHSLPFG